MPSPPETVGRYRIERLIAHGGMGSLYLASDPVIDRMVAIKFLKEGFDDAAARERFAREARAAGRLHHPNIVTVFDVGEHEDRPFIAMEYVAGETLGQLVGRRAVRRLWEKLEILEGLCAGLHYAHSAAIVHRDVKPSNVMRDQTGVVKILDFGIARGAGSAITQAGEVVGTLNYMSPEQLAGDEVDHRSDIYSVGVLAYELVTDQMAFPGTIQTGVLFKILNSRPIPIESLVPGIDPDIPAMIERAIARQPDARYPDLESLRQDLAVVRARLFEMAADVDVDAVADPNAETRFVSPRILSASQTPASSRSRSALGSGARDVTVKLSDQVGRTPWRRPELLLGLAAAFLVSALAAAWMLNRPPASPPGGGMATSVPPQPPAPSTVAPASRTTDAPGRTSPATSPATPLAEPEKKAISGSRQPPEAAPRGTAPNTQVGTKAEKLPTSSVDQTIRAAPALEGLDALPGRVNKPPAAPVPATATPEPEPPPVKRDPPPDPAAAEPAAIRETLRRYADAYQSLDAKAVAGMMPSFAAEQVRAIERDFASYRRYRVEIKDERINIEGQRATVTCQVVRSIETKTGVAQSHTVRSTFHLRRNGSTWTIERLESR